MKVQLHCIIRGKVQGVMFRDFVQRKAQRLDIVGTVENKKDGSVEVFAKGEEEGLQKLLALLHTGPILTRIINRVDNVSAKWGESTQDFSDFRIIY